jgi:hypothetical protein
MRAMTSPQDPQRQPSTSIAAIVALVVALIPLCPPVNFFGAALGVLTMRRIDRSDGKLRGRGLAKSAAIIGLLTGGLSWWGWSTAATWMNDQILAKSTTAVNGFFEAVQAEDADRALQWWAIGPDRPTTAQIHALAEALESAGGLQMVQLSQVRPVEAFTSDVEVWLLCTIGEHRLSSGARLQVELTGVGLPQVQVRFQRLRVDLPDGELRLGTVPATESD